MPKALPSKICVVCQRPFNWRRKWARDWDNVIYCSERCRRNRSLAAVAESGAEDDQTPRPRHVPSGKRGRTR